MKILLEKKTVLSQENYPFCYQNILEGSFKEFISIQWKIVPAASFCLLVTNSPQGDNSGDFLPESTKIPYGLNESG